MCCRDELLIRMGITLHRFFTQLDEAALLQRTQRLIIERSLPQEVGCELRRGQFADGLEELGLARGAFTEFFEFFGGRRSRGADKKLFFPADFRASDHLRQEAAHDGFDRAAIVRAHPAREFEDLQTQGGLLADDCLDRANAGNVRLLENRHHGRERGFFAERDAHAPADLEPIGELIRNEVIELAMNRAIDEDASVVIRDFLERRTSNVERRTLNG